MTSIEKFKKIFDNFEHIPTVHLSSITFGKDYDLIPFINGNLLYSISICYSRKGRLLLRTGRMWDDKNQIIILNPIDISYDENQDDLINLLYNSILK